MVLLLVLLGVVWVGEVGFAVQMGGPGGAV
jgi:hypothetical protein